MQEWRYALLQFTRRSKLEKYDIFLYTLHFIHRVSKTPGPYH